MCCPKPQARVSVTFAIDLDQAEFIAGLCHQDRVSRSALMREAIESLMLIYAGSEGAGQHGRATWRNEVFHAQPHA